MESIGRIAAIYRYPVKSMACEELRTATLGWNGLDGDRRLAFRRLGVRSNFPWLQASKLPSLVTYVPSLETSRVRTPGGKDLDLWSDELREEIAAALGAPVELMELKNGIFDDATISLISRATIDALAEKAGMSLDLRRFRPNFYVETADPTPFPEERWIGRIVRIGERPDGPALSISTQDIRCAMVNVDPDTAASDPRVMKASVELNENRAGVYATVVRTGVLSAGDRLFVE